MTPADVAHAAVTSEKVRVLFWSISSPLADKLFNASNVVVILGALLVFIGTAAAVNLSTARETFSNRRISSDEAETARANAAAEKAREGLEQAKVQLAQANAGEAQARLQLARLRQFVAPREISPEYLSDLADAFHKVDSPIRGFVSADSPESYNLWLQIVTAIHKANRQALPVPDSGNVAGVAPGVVVIGPSQIVTPILNALSKSGIKVTETISDVVPLTLQIGPKPYEHPPS